MWHTAVSDLVKNSSMFFEVSSFLTCVSPVRNLTSSTLVNIEKQSFCTVVLSIHKPHISQMALYNTTYISTFLAAKPVHSSAEGNTHCCPLFVRYTKYVLTRKLSLNGSPLPSPYEVGYNWAVPR